MAKKVLIVGKDHDPELVKKVLNKLEEEGTEVVSIEDIDEGLMIPDPYIMTAPDYNGFYKDLYQDVPKWARGRVTEPVRTEPKVGNNEPCSCGSGLKYKKCCK